MKKISYYIDFLIDFANQNLKKVVIAAIIIVLGVSFIFSDYGIIEIIKNKFTKTELRSKIALETKLSDSLSIRIRKLEYDTLEIERLARELYGMVKPNEKLFIYKYKTKEEKE